MNSLSWLLYFADVVDSFSKVFAVFGVIGVLGFGILCIARAAEFGLPPLKSFYALFAGGFLFILISVFTPSRNTIMYIAASEYGEKIIMSKEVQDLKNPAFELVREWMKKETDRLKKNSQ